MSEEAAVLTGESVLAAKDARVERLAVPEWGGEVCLRVLDASSRDLLDSWQYARSKTGSDSIAGIRLRLVCLALCDAAGQPLFPVEDAESFEQAAAGMAGKSSVVINRLAEVALVLNGIGEEAEERAEGN